MRQPKSEIINLVNMQGKRSDNDASQDQCSFVVFMSFRSGGGVPRVGWLGLVSNRLGCLRGCRVMFVLCVCVCVCTGFLYFLLTIAGQMRSWVSTTSDADLV